jgi:hypothetical protein
MLTTKSGQSVYPCVVKHIHGDVLLDKCKGRTWALVQNEATHGEIMGYVTEEEEEEVKTLVWARIHKGGGMLSFGDSKKED